ncbi:MAG: sulfotransferase family protein [Parvularculaceae bacterium]
MKAPRRPNLFLVGAMKAGTNTLHRLLDAHPDVFMTRKPKEPSWIVGSNSGKDESWYLGLFAEAGDVRYLGEASTDNTRAPRLKGAPEKIKRYSPEARILYIMRDPLDRALSHYWWDVQYSAEGRSFKDAASRSREILDVGNYAMQIAPYLEIFGRDRVHALTLETLTADAPATLKALWDFLDLPAVDVTGGAPPPRYNPGRAVVPRLPGAKYLSHLKDTPVWTAAKAIVPHQMRKRAIARLSKPGQRFISPEEIAEAADALRPRLLEETRALSQLLGRDFAEWRWLNGGPSPSAPR